MLIMESGSGIVLSSLDMSQKGGSRPTSRRRRNVKGLIAGESRGSAAGSGDTNNRLEENNASKPSKTQPRPSSASSSSASLEAGAKSIPHPYCSARLALACVQNALQMGVVTKFFLCPQGRARKTLLGQARLSDRHRSSAEQRFITNPPSQHDVDDGFSSGDDDDFDKSIEQDGRNNINHKNKALHMINARNREPFFIPTGPDASAIGMQGGKIPGVTAGKLPFNYKKIRYFDAVTANDRAVARNFLRQETRNANRSYSKALVNHLKNNEQRVNNHIHTPTDKNDDPIQEQKVALANALTRFPHELKPEISAALVIESLVINQYESIEGMAKCYDGIVSAGMALLDTINDTTIDGSAAGGSNKPKLTTSEIMTALTPLLVTTLEQPSGEVFVGLAKLRNFCGTRRYQRRFVQRIAPFLVRPPGAAIWCLRHQGDIEAIIAAVEMILDNAFDVFSSGWFERGRNILKDTHRAESLRSAASQLRKLNSPSPTGGLLVGLLTPGTQRRGTQASIGFGSIGAKRDGVSNESLEEWEVLAIDDHIRHSVMDLLSRDWSRISTLSNSMKESETPYGRRRGISTSKSKEWQDATTTASSTLSNFGLTKSPRTISSSKLPLSPRNSTLSGGPNTPTSQLPSADALESTFGPSFSSQHVVIEDSDHPPHISPPTTPSSPPRDSFTKLGTPKTPPSHFHEFRSNDRLSMPNLQEQRNSSPSIATEPLSPGSRSREMGNVPLSPPSSAGAYSSGVGTNRSASLTPSIMKDQYRALTSTAAERKRTVAACRALRAQITQFEDAFIKMHGRAPKGFSERAPLASTYTQYREWKRAIRADAACRIQALFRGAKARMMLRRSLDEKIARFVSKRFKPPAKSHSRAIEPTLTHLSIPLDIGRSDSDSPLPRTRLETRTGQRGDDSVEIVMNTGTTSPSLGGTSPTPSSLSPNWRNRSQRRQQQSSGGTSRSSSSRRSSSLPDVTVMSLAELQQRKRELKQQLKQYDMNFHAQHGRMPEKREKEPIRHLYESYNTYKNQISTIEKGEAQPGPGTAAFRGTDVSAPSHSPSASPTFNSGSLTTNPSESHFKKMTDHSTEESKSGEEIESGSRASSQDLASLKAEKATLHQMLRSYEKDFFKEHKRQVSSFADIRPVAGQYRRYKEIKKAIASLS